MVSKKSENYIVYMYLNTNPVTCRLEGNNSAKHKNSFNNKCDNPNGNTYD